MFPEPIPNSVEPVKLPHLRLQVRPDIKAGGHILDRSPSGIEMHAQRRRGREPIFVEMLTEIQLIRYKGFESHTLENLALVNLLVGKNNCGKTSVLEAINLLVSKGNLHVLENLAIMRGAQRVRWRERPYRRIDIVEMSPLFTGHRVPLDAEVIMASNRESLSLRIVPNSEVDAHLYKDADIRRMDSAGDDDAPTIGLKIVADPSADPIPVFPLSKAGSLIYSNRLRRWAPSDSVIPSRFLAPTSLHPLELQRMWGKALREGAEGGVIRALQLLEHDIKSIHFLMEHRSAPDVLLGVRGGGRKLPMSSFGDGIRRLLTLSLSLIDAANGVLLIDEIDGGLHWTVMEDLWRLVISTARQANIQVFATTHNYDCIRGLASLVESSTDFDHDVSIQKIERSTNRAVTFDVMEDNARERGR